MVVIVDLVYGPFCASVVLISGMSEICTVGFVVVNPCIAAGFVLCISMSCLVVGTLVVCLTVMSGTPGVVVVEVCNVFISIRLSVVVLCLVVS